MTKYQKRLGATVVALFVLFALAVWGAGRATATTTTQDSLTLNGGQGRAVFKLHSDACFKATWVGVAVRNSAGTNLDYPGAVQNVNICPDGYIHVTDPPNYPNGSYTVWGFYQTSDGVFHNFPSQTLTVGPVGDTTPPTAPTLTTGTPTSSSVPLSWTGATDNVGVTGYDVYRGTTLVSSNQAGTSYTDTGLTASTAYSYTVKARDAAGNTSPASNTATATTAAGSGAPMPVGVAGSWTPSFSDEFSGTSVDTSKWNFQSSAEAIHANGGTGNPNNQQLEWDQPQNCTVANGVLSMTAKPDNINVGGTQFNWSSCMINTSNSFSYQYGYLEERSQQAAIKGFWPSIWTWAAPGQNISGNGESDNYEFYTDNQTKVYQTQHNSGGGGCTPQIPGGGTAGQWHVYGMDLEPTGTTWYVDGVQTCHVATTSGGLTNVLDDNFVYDGNGNTSLQPAPGSVGVKNVDYVRVWHH